MCEVYFAFNYVNKGSVGIGTQGIEFDIPEVVGRNKKAKFLTIHDVPCL